MVVVLHPVISLCRLGNGDRDVHENSVGLSSLYTNTNL